MTRYATQDAHTGYVWWIGDADTPEHACELSDKESGEYDSRNFVQLESKNSGAGGYLVYIVPDGFDVHDGQKSAEIERLEALGDYQGQWRATPQFDY